jgi:hypothetical protein
MSLEAISFQKIRRSGEIRHRRIATTPVFAIPTPLYIASFFPQSRGLAPLAPGNIS